MSDEIRYVQPLFVEPKWTQVIAVPRYKGAKEFATVTILCQTSSPSWRVLSVMLGNFGTTAGLIKCRQEDGRIVGKYARFIPVVQVAASSVIKPPSSL